MELSRRVFLENSLLGSAALGAGRKDGSAQPGVSVADARPRQVPGPPAYGIIYNWDGAPHDYSEYPQSLEQFLEKTYAPMKDTQVGAHFWCIGEHEAKWRSPVLEMIGDPQNRVYESVRDMRHSEGVRAMIERGENPYEALVKRGHELGMAVYASVRMNDNHFNGLQLQDMPKTVMPGLTRLRKEHPEWCLGAEHAPAWFAASWNFAVPEVREHRLQHITEVCRLADWDGVELDWQRHPFHLPADHAYRLRYTLTDLQRAVRQLTDRIARERGRPFYVAVRVGTTMESCRRIGYDLPVWINERLCDIVTAGGGAGTDPGIEVEAFVDLLKAGSIQFYTGFDGGLWGDHTGLMTDREWYRAWVRGVANGYWDRGCSGMYVFNWHANEKTRRDLLTTIGRPETLKRTNKVYNTLYRHIAPKGSEWAGADLNDRIYGETPVSLYRTLTGNGPNFHLHVHDDVASESRSGSIQRLELHLELEHLSKADKVEVLLDGRALQGPQVRNVKGENPDDPADVDENSWLVWSLTPERIERGPHLVQVRLLERDLRIRPSLVVRHVEVHVDYKA